MNTELLGLYLNDHLTAEAASTELARRISRTRPELRALADDVESDREELLDVMRGYGVEPRAARAAIGRLAEKAGRLKLNGRLLSRSPLSDVLELEGLRLAVEGKAALWRTLRALPGADTDRFDRLLSRVEGQAGVVERERIRIAPKVFTAEQPAGADAGGLGGVDVERTFTVAASPENVVGYLRDFARTEQWDPGTVTCARLDDGPVAVGSRWRNVSTFLGRRTELVYELTRDDPDRLRFEGRNGTATTVDDISVTAGGTPGTTKVGYHVHVELTGLAKLGAPVAKLALEKLGSDTERSLIRVLGDVG
ncbi:SRPBCC family protein [Lentzea chajnantorensis]